MSLSAFSIENIEAVKSIIDTDIRAHHTIDYLAGQAGMGQSRLKETFKQVVKTSMYAYLKKKRMLLAAELLEQSNNTLLQVSKLTGFRYYSNFTRAFRQHFGITPALYGKQFLKRLNDQ